MTEVHGRFALCADVNIDFVDKCLLYNRIDRQFEFILILLDRMKALKLYQPIVSFAVKQANKNNYEGISNSK